MPSPSTTDRSAALLAVIRKALLRAADQEFIGSTIFRMECRLSLAARMLVAMCSGDSRNSEYGRGAWIIKPRRPSIVRLLPHTSSLELTGYTKCQWMSSMVVATCLLAWSLLLGGNGRCHVFDRGLDWCGLSVKKVECGAIVIRRPLTE